MLINALGRCNPSKKCRVFSESPRSFYKIDPFIADYSSQHDTAIAHGLLDKKLSKKIVGEHLLTVKKKLSENFDYKNLFNSVNIPFCFSIPDLGSDLGIKLEDDLLPLLKREFEKKSHNVSRVWNFHKNLKNVPKRSPQQNKGRVFVII